MKLPIENQKDYYNNINEAIALFSPAFKEKCQHNATAHKVIESLARGVSAYALLEQLIDQADIIEAAMKRVIENSSAPLHNVYQK